MLRGSPAFILINGQAAVNLFFVLSGYVLTRKYFSNGNIEGLMWGAVRRWPRLMGPVLLTVLASYALFALNLYFYKEASAISGSDWLRTFATGYDQLPTVTFLGALKQGAFMTFFRGDCWYDGALWTMRPEVVGSLIAFGIAPLLLAAKNTSPWLAAALAAIIGLVTHYSSASDAALVRYPFSSLAAFPAGVLLACLLPQAIRLSEITFALSVVIAIYLLGYDGVNAGIYKLLPDSASTFSAYVNIAGAAIIIASATRLNLPSATTILRLLGDISFPIYLVHIPVIASLGAFACLRWGVAAAAVTSIVASFAAALPLAFFNARWILLVRHLLSPRGAKVEYAPVVAS